MSTRPKGESVDDEVDGLDYGEAFPQPKIDFELMPFAIPAFPNQFQLLHAEYDLCKMCGSDRCIILNAGNNERMCLDCKDGGVAFAIQTINFGDQLSDGNVWAALSGYLREHEDFMSVVEPGCEGPWRITKSFPTDQAIKDSEALDLAWTGGRGVLREREYTTLIFNGGPVRSDTPDGITDYRFLHQWAEGRVLLNGLGMGTALQIAIRDERVKSVEVIEADKDLRKLILPSIRKAYPNASKKIHVHQCEWPDLKLKEKRWDVVFHDDMGLPNPSNLPHIWSMEAHFRGHVEEWMGSCRKEWTEHFLAPNWMGTGIDSDLARLGVL